MNQQSTDGEALKGMFDQDLAENSRKGDFGRTPLFGTIFLKGKIVNMNCSHKYKVRACACVC